MNPFHKNLMFIIFLILAHLLSACTSTKKQMKYQNLRGDYIFRKHDEYFYRPFKPLLQNREKYPWEDDYTSPYPLITKEYFRCKGNPLNPVATKEREGKETLYFRDCDGQHGLPLSQDNEFIYPCLLNLLNYIQKTTSKRVVITTGHRCPRHNAYCDSSPYNWSSKHLLGAEVDFYVEGMESQPEKIIQLIQEYYKDDPEYKTFSRYEKEGLNVTISPWYNKEIFIKLYREDEGRDLDNLHPYPYLSIQMRYDRQTEKKITFDQKQAENYMRH